MLTIKDIIRATRTTHNQVWKNKKDVRIYYQKVEAWRAEDGTKVRTVKAKARDAGNGSGRYHYLQIDFYGRGTKDPQLWCTCSCEYFFYHCAWVLTDNDASDHTTDFGTVGWKPKITNPSNSPRACKHIIRALTGEAPKLTPQNYRGRRDRG